MSEVGRYKDSEGRVHFAARESKTAVEGLAKGLLVDIDAPVPVEPPRRGPGSGVEAWREHGSELGIDGAEGMSRDELFAAVDALKEESGAPPQHGEDHESGTSDSGSGVGERTTGASDGDAGAGPDQSGVRS